MKWYLSETSSDATFYRFCAYIFALFSCHNYVIHSIFRHSFHVSNQSQIIKARAQLNTGNALLRPPQEEFDGEFTCEIGIEPGLASERKFRNRNKCTHCFCTECVIHYIRVELEDNNVGSIKCPAVGCAHALDPLHCAAMVGPSLFERWCDVLCESAILELDKCYCPNLSCNEPIVNECGRTERKSKCPKCKQLFCFECKRVWHAGFECEESASSRDVNDVAFGRLVESLNWSRCPRCRHFIELLPL